MAPSILWFAATQDIKCEQNLTGLAPKGCFISAEAVESAVRQIGRRKKQRVSSMGGIGAGFVGSAHGSSSWPNSQCRAARGLLDWSQADLADRARVGIVTVRQFEAGAHAPRRATIEVIKRAFEAAGVEFIDETAAAPGVGIRKRRPRKE